MARIYTLQEENQFLCNISLRLVVPCFSMVMDCIIIQVLKGLTKKLYFVILSRRKICNNSLRFIVHIVMGCNIIQEVKGLTKKLYFVLLSMRKTSFYAKFQINCSHCLPVFAWLWLAL